MSAYYNEFDPHAAAWLRELIKQGLIADGEVDTRSIKEVRADDLRGFTQSHFFAGIGGWSLSLRLAGIPDDYPVWTGSCPCQPFSAAGSNKGKSDDRHLWPEFYRLIAECRPSTIFGEQVEGAVKHGWLDDLQADMEREGYAVGSAVLGAHSVGSFHQRQRMYWVANTNSIRCNSREEYGEQKARKCSGNDSRSEHNDRMGNAEYERHDNNQVRGQIQRSETERRLCEPERPGSDWLNPDWIYCRDNKYRPIKPSLKPLVNGLSGGVVRGGDHGESVNAEETTEARVMRLKGYGNAIVPQLAAEFIKAFFGNS